MAARPESARRVSDCVTALLRDQPFFGSLALIGRSFMLDAQPAAKAPARPPALQPLHPSPANADTTGVRPKPAALLAAATALLPNLEAGRTLDAKTLREAMSAAFGASDTQGAWVWKDAYEAAEAAMVLFIQRYGRLMRREAGAGPGAGERHRRRPGSVVPGLRRGVVESGVL